MPIFTARSRKQAEARLALRDLMILCFLVLSVAIFAGFPKMTHPAVRALAGGLAIYRILDIGFTLLAIAVFGSIRHGAALNELPRHRVQRLLIAIMINYIEMMFWFATVYLWIAGRDPNQFILPVYRGSEAFFVSMSTMTTIGYGRHSPVGTSAQVVATVQAVLGLVVLLMVIGGLVGSLSEDSDEIPERPRYGPERYVAHVVAPLVAYVTCIVAGWHFIGA